MYIPKHFDAGTDPKILDFLKTNNFGELVGQIKGRPFATHLPVICELDNRRVLMHMARANPQWQHLESETMLLIINGPHGYISPSWYVDGGVPTWNYQSIHIYGTAKLITEPTALATIVDSLSRKEEEAFEAPWAPNYPESMLRGIVGIELSIEEIECKFKLSQNRSSQEQYNVAKQLELQGNMTLASAMRKENGEEYTIAPPNNR